MYFYEVFGKCDLEVVNKKVYVVSDIHNDADRFKLLLKKLILRKMIY